METNPQHNQLVFELAESTLRLDYVYNQQSVQEIAPNVVIQPNSALESGPLTKLVRTALGDIAVCYPQTKMIYWWVLPTQTALINLLDANDFSISAYSLLGNVDNSLSKLKPIFNPGLVIYPLESTSSWQHTYLPMLVHHQHNSPEHFHHRFSQAYLDLLNSQVSTALGEPNKTSSVLCLHLLDKPIGFAFASIVKNIGIINMILVKTSLQGQGYGKHLYFAALNWLREMQIANFYGTTINEHILRSAGKMGRKILHVKLQKEL